MSVYVERYNMPRAILCDQNNEVVREVQNLGWLIRHRDEVNNIEVRMRYGHRLGGGCYMTAYLWNSYYLGKELGSYQTPWEDHTVCLDWIRRRFGGLPLIWFGLETTVPERRGCR